MATFTIEGRLAFPNLFKPDAFGEGEPSYSANIIMAPDSPHVKKINAEIEACAKEKWGAKADSVLKALRAKDKICLHDGDGKAQFDGFEGNVYLVARSKVRPTVVNRDKTILNEGDGVIYSGCYVRAIVEVRPQDNEYGQRVNCSLAGVQFVKDGEAFAGGRPASVDDFEDISEGATADDLG